MRNLIYNLAHDRINNPIAAIVKVGLWVLSFFYWLAISLRRFLYQIKIFKSHRLNCKVISVGNITWGGAGKTPTVEYIAKYLKGKGCKVAILSRGYGRRGTLLRQGFVGQARGEGRGTNCEAMGDEPFMLKNNLGDIPILVGEDRIKNGKLAIAQYGADTLILDDGFQHWRISRDLDIVVIDSTNPFGNNHLIPRGILREPLNSLKRAEVFLFTRVNLAQNDIEPLKKRLNNINPQALIVESIHNPINLSDQKGNHYSLDYLKSRNLCIVSSIANPESFKKTILNLGANISLNFSFPDHYDYKEKDLNNIFRSCQNSGLKTIVTTQKDAARIPTLEKIEKEIELLILKIEIKIIQNEEQFLRRLSAL